MHSDLILLSHIVFMEHLGIRHEAKHSVMHFIQHQQTLMYLHGSYIDHICTQKGRSLLPHI